MNSKLSAIGREKRPRYLLKGGLVAALLAGSSTLPFTSAQAGETFDLGDGVTFTLGTGVRTSVSAVSAFAPSAGYAAGHD